MNQTEYNNAFNQGVEAGAKKLDKFLFNPKEGEQLTPEQIRFNDMVKLFQLEVKGERKNS